MGYVFIGGMTMLIGILVGYELHSIPVSDEKEDKE